MIAVSLTIYGYLNRVQSSRRLEREAGRNVEVMWLTGRLVPDHKTIANFRKDNGIFMETPLPTSRYLRAPTAQSQISNPRIYHRKRCISVLGSLFWSCKTKQPDQKDEHDGNAP